MNTNDIPEYWKPAIGFALWHLQQGDDTKAILDAFRTRHRQGDLTENDLLSAVAIARRCLDLCDLWSALHPFVNPDDSQHVQERCRQMRAKARKLCMRDLKARLKQ